MRHGLLLFLCTLLSLCCLAQNSKKVNALKQQKAELQKSLKKSQSELSTTKKNVRTGIQNLSFLGSQMNNRLQRIHQMESEMQQLDSCIESQQTTIVSMERELQKKRARLTIAMRYARMQRASNSPLLFALSSKSLLQMYRRARYARDMVVYERNLGEQILNKQAGLLEIQNSLLENKSQLNETACEVMIQRKQLNEQQVQTQRKVDGLKKKEIGLANKVAEQQRQINALDKKIEQLIAYEIEQARKKAEEEARRKAAAQKKAGKDKTANAKGGTAQTSPQTWLTPEDRKLNGTFEQNKGRLPVPITGQYMLGNRFGVYNVPGLNNVQLDNKGTNYIGRSGARARAVFNGEVTAIFQFNGSKNVLVRHGSYISVYCNLSSVIVQKGQKVSTRDILGTVQDDGSGNCVLHFQLRKETAKLNPES
ncbi:MAG: peptidoglycan DD-metalloendopeptidase family protein, partial [Bacteroidaceae bacterium]|nr:peptidoglycan DD-metalloendopeptidase family protein [Bacteroidaceae bacterium]